MDTLNGTRVAILIDNGFEEVEMTETRKALEDAGAKTQIISPQKSKVRAWGHTKWSNEYDVQETLDHAKATDFDALLLPGGVMNPDFLRMNPNAVAFVREFFEAGKPVAAICHGPWMVIEAGGARGRKITSWPSLKTDLKNAGAAWVDQEVVVDRNLITSRKPDDIPAFNREMMKLFGQKHGKKHAA
jgi:protease I